MKKLIGLTLIVMVATQSAAGQNAYVTGRVVEAETDHAVPGAKILVYFAADPGNVVTTVYTDESGSYNAEIGGIYRYYLPFIFTVTVVLPEGFEPVSSVSQEIYVEQEGYGYLLEDFLAVRIPTYVEGYVKDAETGSGISGIQIIVVPEPPAAEATSGYTDEEGLYSIQIDKSGFVAGTYEVVLNTYDGYDVAGISSYYVFIPTPGRTYVGPIDFLLTPKAPGGGTFVTGSVIDVKTSQGIPGVEIKVYGPAPSTVLVVSGATDEFGNFELPIDEAGFKDGTYTVWAGHVDYIPINGNSSQDIYVDIPGNPYDFILHYGPVNFEMARNTPPVVDAGPDISIAAASTPQSVQLNGTAYDPDDFPDPLDIEWSRAAGPGSVTFDDDSSAVTAAHFSVPGVYSLTLTADDGLAAVSDEIQITVGQTPTTAGPAALAHWKLDEGSGLMARDSSGNGHDATLVGSPRWVDGPAGFGNALAFNGDDYVEIAEEAPFDLTDALTVATWVNIERITADWTAVLTKGNSAWRLSTFLSENRFHFAVTGPDAGPNWIHGDTRVGLGEWHHVTGTYDGVAIRLYVDGVEDPAGPVAYSGPISTNDFPVRLADNAQVPGWGLIGKIDDVRIYDCALTQGEIASVMGISMPTLGAVIPLPPAGHFYHGVYPGEAVADSQPLPPDGIEFEEDGITPEDLLSYEQHAGKTAAWVYFSHNWFRDRDFPLSTASWIRDVGGIPYIRLMMRSSSEQDVAEPVFTLNRIIRGDFDGDLRTWMGDARDFGSALIVEYGTEVNGEWFSWNGSWNGAGAFRGYGDPLMYDGPERFRDAYRHIIQIAREENASNITWVFHVDAYDIPDEHWNRLELYYPGDEWIDWLGVSVYGALDPTDDGWPRFRFGMDEAYARLAALSTDKPIALLEFGVTSGNPLGDQARWAEAALTDIVALRWPRLIGFSWWNESWQNDNDPTHDSNLRIQDNPALTTVFQRLVGNESKVIGNIN